MPVEFAECAATNLASWRLHSAAQNSLGVPKHFAAAASAEARASPELRGKELAVHRSAAKLRHNIPLSSTADAVVFENRRWITYQYGPFEPNGIAVQ